MPNGYTADIIDGKDLTAAGYIRRSGRGFGFAMRQRDSDPNEPVKKIEEESFYSKNHVKAIADLAEWNKLEASERRDAYDEYVADTQKRNRESTEKAALAAARIGTIRSYVEAANWPDDLSDMKSTVIEWLDETEKFDGKAYVYPIKDFATWEYDRTQSLRRNVEYYAEQVADEKKRIREQHRYVDLFENVIKQIEEMEGS